MASGMGVRGTKGRCFDFYSDFMLCKVASEQRETLTLSEIPHFVERVRAMEKKDDQAAALKAVRIKPSCLKQREDYLECLHGQKQDARIRAVAEEKKRQEREQDS